MKLIGTMLVGPHEKGLEKALESLKACGCDAIHVLIDTLDEPSRNLLQKYNCAVFSRPWNWEFGPARQALQETIPEGTNWQLWLDTDDVIPPETCAKIKELVKTSKPAIYYLPYVYVTDSGKETSRLFRERLFPPVNVHWRMRAHEYPAFAKPLPANNMEDMPIHHCWKPNEEGRVERYVEALEKDLKDSPSDARIMHYLAQSLRNANRMDDAIEMFEKYLATGGWDEERMKACIELSHMYQGKGDLDKALEYANKADVEKPNRREAYQRVAEIYSAKEDWQSAYDWIKKELEIP